MKFCKSISILSLCFFLVCNSAARADYTDNLDGTVTDTGTGLMWQQDTSLDKYNWELALAYCENLELADYTDWRLPTAKELASIVDRTMLDNMTINIIYFPDTLASIYWSSTTDANYSGFAFCVYFNYGYVYSYSKGYDTYVRAVRSVPSWAFNNLTFCPVAETGQTKCYDNSTEIACPQLGQEFYGQDANYSINTPAYTKLADNCTILPDNATTWAMVRDEVTGLVWEEKHARDNETNYADPNDADNYYSWYDNNSATNGGDPGTLNIGPNTMDFIRTLNTASYGGFSDWRMPTVKELQSIVDYGRVNPSINIMYSPNTVASFYWSSTPSAYRSDYAWYVYFNYGLVDCGLKSGYGYGRAVLSGQCGSFGCSTTTTTVSGGECLMKKVLGEDYPELENLRYFRDSKLAQSEIGRKIIQIYYKNSHSINAALERRPTLRAATRRVLEAIAPMVGNK